MAPRGTTLRNFRCDDDRWRIVKMCQDLSAIRDAMNSGVDIRGVLHWSLMDNYEWTWGYDMRFGIIYVDYETQRRIPKDSAKLYSRIIASRELNVAPDAGLLVRRGTLLENVPVI